MQARFQIQDPKKIEAVLTVSATVGELIEVRKQIAEHKPHTNYSYELGRLASAIDEAIAAAQKHFIGYPKDDAAE